MAARSKLDPRIKLHEFPELENPILIAGWPGMGYVAYGAVDYLRRKFNAKFFAELDSRSFFRPHEVWVRNGILDLPDPSRNHFYYIKDSKDLIVFLGDSQPPMPMEMEQAELILSLAMEMKVSFVYTFAAMPTRSSASKKPSVYGAPTHPELLEILRKHGIPVITGTISGMNGLLLGVAKVMGLKGICLLGEIPYYTIEIRNPKSSLAVLEVFCKLEGMELDLEELRMQSQMLEAQLEQMEERFRQELIKYGRETPSYIA